jgi:hypothetical protein
VGATDFSTNDERLRALSAGCDLLKRLGQVEVFGDGIIFKRLVGPALDPIVQLARAGASERLFVRFDEYGGRGLPGNGSADHRRDGRG